MYHYRSSLKKECSTRGPSFVTVDCFSLLSCTDRTQIPIFNEIDLKSTFNLQPSSDNGILCRAVLSKEIADWYENYRTTLYAYVRKEAYSNGIYNICLL